MSATNSGSEGWNIVEVKRLVDHQDNISSLVSVNGKNIFIMLLVLLVTSEIFHLWSFYLNQSFCCSETYCLVDVPCFVAAKVVI